MEDWVWLVLLGVTGFLLGGVWSLWKTAKTLAILLLVGAVIAGVATVLWLI
ncbi:hypothetical protein [Actinoalloteichus hymeniacidonis]|uniref:Uncharacterized protein n=1 Tax=Actinoalloteichus hymeniacidonis TaxID=340345 RepID=A0AAC9HNQ5_9PSEU|nr:hypothetical protein [Actinoalloteichus hymeniacidonis]AOS62757.1 hypothetical protein TL08_09710 [Actinoalloteichus hymeniacidonis]MBB5909212.1 membrane protein DedA with SNARE-associated domain [Actinoalloteichus hymeniacidonis]